MLEKMILRISVLNMPMIYDNGLLMAIIAIDMSIIGLTSLADQKCVIGIDYGKFLITKFKLGGIRMYYWILYFALINIASLFLMFVEQPIIRVVNFILLIISLVFAIFYFFGFIIIENRWVQEKIYMSELLGLYFDDANKKHMEIDRLVSMNPGNRSNKRISTNVIAYFNGFNGDTEKVFNDVFGPEWLIYSDRTKVVRYRKKQFGIKRYNYRVGNTDPKIKEISFEFFQLFRYSEMQDKLAINILKIMNGEPNTYKEYEILRLYNLARLIVQIDIFGFAENLYKYKFVPYLKEFIFKTVEKDKDSYLIDDEINHIREVERCMIKSLVSYFTKSITLYSNLQFINCIQEFLNEIVLLNQYKGYLEVQEIVEIFVDVSIALDCKKLQEIINISSNLYNDPGRRVTKEEYIDIEQIKKDIQVLLNKKSKDIGTINIFTQVEEEQTLVHASAPR